MAAAFSTLTYCPIVAAALKKQLLTLQPDIVILTEPWLFAYLPLLRLCGTRIVVDLHNIEQPLYSNIRRSARRLRTRIRAWLLHAIARVAEPAVCAQAESVWVCSASDAKLVRTLYGPLRDVRVIPSGIDMQYYAHAQHPAIDQLQATPRLLFSANFAYGPNAEAVDWLLDEILPNIRTTQRSCILTLAGMHPTRAMRGAANKDSSVVVTGTVSDMRPYLQAPNTVVIIPLRHGSGTRLKVLEAFASGVPVISTRKGVEGLGVLEEQEFLLAESAAEFATAAQRLWLDAQLRTRLCAAAKDFLQRTVSPDALLAAVRDACDVAATARAT